MTITYPDGTSVQAILLSRSIDTLRAAVTGDDDLRTFTLVDNTWVSEGRVQVTIKYEWQLGGEATTPAMSECICSKQLASRLISHLLNPNRDILEEELFYVFSAQGGQLAVQQSELRIN